MSTNLSAELNRLKSAPVSVLIARYEELFGEQPRARNRLPLLRRVAWRLQANVYGGLSDSLRQRALEMADLRDLRLSAPLPRQSAPRRRNRTQRDDRLPLPGAVIHRQFQGKTIRVKVLADGCEYNGRWFRSLSGVAEAVTGTRWNGFSFFGLRGPHAV
jgi:hypothetical protein